ncbi:MAG TPA: hypothetical protein VFY61_05220 [Pyrinomonadaceae bacterium]|nr:hypothetical protein [Pyrinomonadaceae bacterium]
MSSILNTFKLHERVALVTGASTGLGRLGNERLAGALNCHHSARINAEGVRQFQPIRVASTLGQRVSKEATLKALAKHRASIRQRFQR